MSEKWEELFDRLFVMDTDNGSGPEFLFLKLANGSRTIAKVSDLKAFIAEILRQESQMSINVKKCQRCGKDHDAMEFKQLSNPSNEFSRFGFCPITNQPVLLAVLTVPGAGK